MSSEFDLSLYADFTGLISWLKSKGQGVEIFSQRVLPKAERIMRSVLEQETPIVSRELFDSIVSLITPNSVSVFPTAEHTSYVERGTRPHEIRPKTKKALHFFIGGGTLKTLFGKEIFAKVVKHPGFPGRFFIRRAHTKSRSLVFALAQEVFAEEMERA